MEKKSREFIPLILLFIIFNNLFFFGKNWLAKYGLNYIVLIYANTLFFAVSLLVYRMQQKAAQNKNPNVFVRAVMGGTMIKMAVCVIAVGVYAFAFKSIFNRMTVIAAIIVYFIYLVVEVNMATKMNKKKNA